MGDLLAEVLDAEKTVWRALVSADTESYRAALAEDFEGVYPDGFFGRADQLGFLAKGPIVTDFALSDERIRPVGGDHALLSYRAVYTRVGQERPEAMRVSSLWRRNNGGWINLFSQDTPDQPV